MNIDNDGGGRFSGSAGMELTEADLRQNIGVMICDGAEPSNLQLRTLENTWIFSGNC
ncbi:hypothetical protein [Paracoccus sp. M683]|uniref:hypothetical protein n=1 Tax=Paracoccus sp. M683 TaxID=2594268 RepID=UPI00163DB1DA|nr:hypothetical protein [Paracoccus sp. M683]